jgi:hypothetical protein
MKVDLASKGGYLFNYGLICIALGWQVFRDSYPSFFFSSLGAASAFGSQEKHPRSGSEYG